MAYTQCTEEQLVADAVRLQLALLGSASTSVISPKHWWDRAASAMETAASAADSLSSFVSRAAKKLQIDVLTESSSAEVADLATTYGDCDAFEQLRAFIAQDVIYITAMSRAEKAAARQAQAKEVEQ